MQLSVDDQLSDDVIKITGQLIRMADTQQQSPVPLVQLRDNYSSLTAPTKGMDGFQRFLESVVQFQLSQFIDATLHFSFKEYETGFANSIPNRDSNDPESTNTDKTILLLQPTLFKPSQPFELQAHVYLSQTLFHPAFAKQGYIHGFSMSIQPGKKFDAFKNTFLQYLDKFMNEAFVASDHDIYSYLFQRDHCIQLLKNMQRGFGKVHVLAEPAFQPKGKFLFHHLVHALEIESLIEVMEGFQSSYSIKLLKKFTALSIPPDNEQHRSKEGKAAFKFNKRQLSYRQKPLDIPGKYSVKLLATLFSKERPISDYWTAIDIYEHWGYDTDKMLEVANKKRVYHAARKINTAVKMQTGKVDFIEEDKGDERYRLNPRYFN